MPFPQRRALVGALSLLLPGAALADAERTGYPLDILTELDRIIVSATLNERAVRDVASDVSVIDAVEIDRRQAQDIAELVRYEPGVSVTASATRFGLGGFRIRGLGGDRVRIEVDGIPIPDEFAIGSFSNAGRDLVDVDALKRVEIIRGAASSLYGSDALGGVVSFVTKDPSDYLVDGDSVYVAGKAQYASVNRQASLTGSFAGGNAANGIVVVATHRDGHATDNQGSVDSDNATRTRPNPQQTESNALLAKYVHTAEGGRVDRITLDGEKASIDTDALSARTLTVNGTRTTSLLGDDSRSRQRLSFGQEIPFGAGWLDSLDWKAYVQHSETRQDTVEDRSTATGGVLTNPVQRHRRFDYEQRVVGTELTARRQWTGGAIEHAVTWGLDLSRTRTQEQRDGFQLNLTSGASTPNIPPDAFPVRDFPITETTTAALFAQDEMTLADGRLSLIPAIRVDSYRLDPRNDAIFAADNPGIEPEGLDELGWSPKLGAIWRFSDRFNAFAQYAQGFRAPPFDDVNIGFTNIAFGYTAIPNPDLKPEKSRGLEVGLRGSADVGWFSVSTYANRYRDFIESLAFVGINDDGLMVFQSRNLNRVRIRGAEARYGVNLGTLADALQGFSIKGSFATARGDDETADEPLVSIDPRKAVLGLAYDRERWGAELVGSFVDRKDRLPSGDPANGVAAPFAAPGYSTLDLYLRWQPLDRLELFAAVTNLADRTYWNWGMASGLTSTSSVLDRYTAPGRAGSFGIRATF
ncbi:MAG: TonB-dependent hemoglobin/transferrin/lactoferrin family receptor [Xanthomonadales bacterium]|nr:TonB-dependent hemoglobin/transferrin/lactoferrin family receptor [Xanthomonadales bacterium]